jgi:T4 RnlA family RNA ligase
MNYTFPTITNIADVLPAIQGRDEFVVADKGSYTVINYNVMMADTFPDVDSGRTTISGERIQNFDAAIRRECRGITFDTATGDIIRRPFSKFFNVNEREETQLHNLDFSKEHWVDTKLDGSMIAVFMHGGELIYGTKMVAPDFNELVKQFVAASDIDYDSFCRDVIEQGYTPIFEFMHPQKRIVIDYGEPALTLLAVRNMITGEYVPLTISSIESHSIPVVEQHGSVEDPKSFIEYVRDLKNAEGFVIRWSDGHRVKIKAHEYLQIHKAKEAILQDRNIVELILEEHLDDIKAHLPAEDRDRLTQFENDFNTDIAHVVVNISKILYDVVGKVDRKTFAIDIAPKLDPYIRPIVFKNFDGYDLEKIYEDVHNMIRNNLSRTAKYEAIRDVWFPGVIYNV